LLFPSWSPPGREIQGNPYIVSLRGRYPRLTRWAGRRFSRQHPYGLALTAGVAAAAASLLLFLNITQAVVLRTSFAGLDQRILNLVPHIRTSEKNVLFGVLTFAASSASFAVFLIVLILASWRARKLWLPVLFAGAFLVRTIGSTAIKQLIGRPRPDRSLGLVTENGFSFPSGHTLTATVLAGLLAYLLVRVVRSYVARLLILLAAITAVLLVGLSRVYLGVHYPSDVLGSFALGLFILPS
jgi:membrane-associated phospholipid phosphatase